MRTSVVKPFRLDDIRLLVPRGVGSLKQRERWSSPKIILEDHTASEQAVTREEFPSPAQIVEGPLESPDLEHDDNRRAKEGDDEKSDDGAPEAQDQSSDARRCRAQATEIDKANEEKLERAHNLSRPLPLRGMVLQRATDPPPMRRFHFHLRARGMIHRDIDGTELPDVTSARAHAAAVADKLMRHSGAPTRQWSIFVEDDAGKSQFELLFVDVDASIAQDSSQMRLLFPGACSPTAVTETCRRLGEPVDPEQSTTLPSESVALTTATQNLPSRHLDGMPLKRSGLPPERESKRLGAILSIGIACAVVAPIAYFAVGNPFASGSHGFRLRQEIQNAMGLPAVSETVSEAGQSEAARGKQLANAEPPNVVSDKKQPVGQLSHPVPMAIERPAEAVAPALTSRAVPLSPLASAPASLPEQPQPGPGRVMAMRPNGMDPDQIQLLLKQGQEFMAVGDLATARVVLRRAAEAGAVAAAFALAQCYDPKVLTQMHALGVAPDISEARRWYEIAGQLRSAEAACVASSRADRRRPSCPTP